MKTRINTMEARIATLEHDVDVLKAQAANPIIQVTAPAARRPQVVPVKPEAQPKLPYKSVAVSGSILSASCRLRDHFRQKHQRAPIEIPLVAEQIAALGFHEKRGARIVPIFRFVPDGYCGGMRSTMAKIFKKPYHLHVL